VGADVTDGLIMVADNPATPAIPNTTQAISSFFDGFKAKIASTANRLAGFFGADQDEAPVSPATRMVTEAQSRLASAPVIDLNARLATFSLTGSDAVARQLTDAQRWKRELAGVPADVANPNSALRIPVCREAAGRATPT
jgi:hypothetical protein